MAGRGDSRAISRGCVLVAWRVRRADTVRPRANMRVRCKARHAAAPAPARSGQAEARSAARRAQATARSIYGFSGDPSAKRETVQRSNVFALSALSYCTLCRILRSTGIEIHSRIHCKCLSPVPGPAERRRPERPPGPVARSVRSTPVAARSSAPGRLRLTALTRRDKSLVHVPVLSSRLSGQAKHAAPSADIERKLERNC